MRKLKVWWWWVLLLLRSEKGLLVIGLKVGDGWIGFETGDDLGFGRDCPPSLWDIKVIASRVLRASFVTFFLFLQSLAVVVAVLSLSFLLGLQGLAFVLFFSRFIADLKGRGLLKWLQPEGVSWVQKNRQLAAGSDFLEDLITRRVGYLWN